MKRALLLGSLTILSSITGFAAEQTWTGKISNSICGLSHSKMGKMGENPKECVLGCVTCASSLTFPVNPFIRAYDNFLDLAFGLERGWKCEGKGSVFEASSLQTNDLGNRQDIFGQAK